VVELSLDLTHPTFAGLNPKKIRLVIKMGFPPIFSYETYPNNLQNVGEPGVKIRKLEIGGHRPIRFDNDDFALLGKVSLDVVAASQTLAQIVALMRKKLLIVKKDGAPLTPEQVLDYTP